MNMDIRHRRFVPRKACTRCSSQKRRCDKVLPNCGNCSRLRQQCQYELPEESPLSPASSSPTGSAIAPPQVLTPTRLKDSIVSRLGSSTPEDIVSIYSRAIEPWFPVVSITKLHSPPLATWEEAPLDIVCLCLLIKLISTNPPSSSENNTDASDFQSLYLYTKTTLASTEALGVNSVLVVQCRVLVTLFEVSHGLYPAAYISIGATVRAMEALQIYPDTDVSPPGSGHDRVKQEEMESTWCGIQVLERYVAIESRPYQPLAGLRTESRHSLTKPTMCMTEWRRTSQTGLMSTVARFPEASYLLDKVHTALNSPTAEQAFNIEEITLTVQTLSNLQTILLDETGDGIPLYTVGLTFSNTALLLAFESGSKMPPTASSIENVNQIATESLISMLSSITSAVEPFTAGTQLNFDLLPPFTLFLVYKAASMVTERLLMDSDSAEENLKRLRVLRGFLQVVGKRWLGCKRYLDLLDEDTTPRILKAIKQA
ncbi:hypothetical protein DL95DRAFT_521379 [Leptodontidium sp. 2 PMI_412]|nr:hypothetical protein DL95DRAFT_521379 [Leptodontidium sp. 2 PMI_412]